MRMPAAVAAVAMLSVSHQAVKAFLLLVKSFFNLSQQLRSERRRSALTRLLPRSFLLHSRRRHLELVNDHRHRTFLRFIRSASSRSVGSDRSVGPASGVGGSR